MSIKEAGDGAPGIKGVRYNIEILFTIGERVLTLEELHWHCDVQRRINEEAERVSKMSDAELMAQRW